MRIIKQSYEIKEDYSNPKNVAAAMHYIEDAARICYKSENRTNHEKESWRPLIKSLVERGHMTPLEQAGMHVKFITDRGLSHEIVRHRLASLNQESTRYCMYTQKEKFGGELTMILPGFLNEDYDIYQKTGVMSKRLEVWIRGREADEEEYKWYIEDDLSAQHARTGLPIALKTELIVYTNFREWRHILDLRTAEGAHPDMINLMTPLKEELAGYMPEIFGDL